MYISLRYIDDFFGFSFVILYRSCLISSYYIETSSEERLTFEGD